MIRSQIAFLNRRKFSYIGASKMLKSILLITCLVSSALFAGCASKEVKEEPGLYDIAGKRIEEVPVETVEIGVEDIHSEPGKTSDLDEHSVVLVFGPGLARGFAFAGVLKEFEKQQIAVRGVVGIEMGALIAAIYATSDTINEFEWKLLRLKKEIFLRTGFSISKFFTKSRTLGDDGELNDVLDKLFGNKKLESARIPLRVGIFSNELNKFVMIQNGELKQAVRGALSDPILYKAVDWAGGLVSSAGRYRPFPVDEVRHQFKGKVVVVDVIESLQDEVVHRYEGIQRDFAMDMYSAWEQNKSELFRADLVIQPQLDNIGYFDFDKKTSAVFKGKVAIKDSIDKLQRSLGMIKEEDEGTTDENSAETESTE